MRVALLILRSRKRYNSFDELVDEAKAEHQKEVNVFQFDQITDNNLSNEQLNDVSLDDEQVSDATLSDEQLNNEQVSDAALSDAYLSNDDLRGRLLEIATSLQKTPDTWINLVQIGTELIQKKISYRDFGFAKLRPFLESFDDTFEFYVKAEPGKTPVYFLRPRGSDSSRENAYENAYSGSAYSENESRNDADLLASAYSENDRRDNNYRDSSYRDNGHREKFPTVHSWLTKWAFIHYDKYPSLAGMALQERWYCGEDPEVDDEYQRYALLRNYLNYTFLRLVYERKVLIKKDLETNEEYAAFNTGLVDRKYNDIFALFKKSDILDKENYWYLIDFVVAGEDAGKTLVRVFNPLPARANYFGKNLQNMLYDTSTGDLSCDYQHIIIERLYRFPVPFLKKCCPPEMRQIGDMDIDDAYDLSAPLAERKAYFEELAQRIDANNQSFNWIKNRLEYAIKMALKRVEWNYKTAIPMYNPKHKKVQLLLPLSLLDENKVDLALVVQRYLSGAYQGETILPLDRAYGNSRLVTRPDSDWLKTEGIHLSEDGVDDDENIDD